MVAGAVVAGTAPLPSAYAGDFVRLVQGRSQVVRVPRPAETVVVGDPAIADVSIQDATTLVLTAKKAGETNIIILDEAGDPIVDETIVVDTNYKSIVRVYGPKGLTAYQCAPECSAPVAMKSQAIGN